MNHPTEPPHLVKMLIGVTAVMVILLTGVTLGVLTEADTITSISGSASPSVSQEQEESYTRPVLHLDSTDRLKSNRGSTKSCSQASPAPGSKPDADTDTEQCSRRQPLRIDKQKLLVLLAIWRFKS